MQSCQPDCKKKKEAPSYTPHRYTANAVKVVTTLFAIACMVADNPLLSLASLLFWVGRGWCAVRYAPPVSAPRVL